MTLHLKQLDVWLLIAAVFGLGISYSSLYLFHVLCVIHLVATITSNRFKFKFPLAESREGLVLLGISFWYACTVIWSIDIIESLKYLFYIACGLYIVHVLLGFGTSIDRFKQANQVVLAVFAIEVFLCLLEVFTNFRLPVSPLSEVLHLAGRDESSRLYLETSTPTGFRWNPNDLAISMAILLPFTALSSNKALRFILAPLILLLIIMTSSRGVFISLVVGVAAYLLLFKLRYFMALAIASILAITIFIYNISWIEQIEIRQVQEITESYEILRQYLFESSTESETSIGIRKQVLELGAEALDKTMFVGVGAGGSIAYLKAHGGVGTHKVSSMHNFWMEILVDAGVIVGSLVIISYIVLLIKMIKIAHDPLDSFNQYYGKAMATALVIFSFGAISSSSTIYLFPMWIMLGLAMSFLKLNSQASVEKSAKTIPSTSSPQ